MILPFHSQCCFSYWQRRKLFTRSGAAAAVAAGARWEAVEVGPGWPAVAAAGRRWAA